MVTIRRRYVIAAAAIFIVAMTLVALFAEDDFWRVALPGYLTGAGTLALAVVAYLTMVQEAVDRKTLQAEARRERDRADEAERREREARDRRERRAQAELVQVQPINARGGHAVSERGVALFHTGIVNRSQYPISDLRFFLGVDPEVLIEGYPTLPTPPERLVGNGSWESDFEIIVAPEFVGTERVEPELWMLFTDANGVRWVRDPTHQLAEATVEYVRKLTESEELGMINAPVLP